MTISNTSRVAGPFLGNGITKNFPFSFKVFSRDNLLVAKTVTATNVETVLTLDADYTVTLNQNQNSNPGGVIFLKVAPPVGTTLAATSALPIEQTLDLTNLGGFYPEAISDALDKIVIQIQQLANRVGLGLNVGAAAQLQAVLDFIGILAAETGASKVGFLQVGVDATLRTLESKLREYAVSITDYKNLAFTATAKDQADGNSHVAKTFTSWRLAVQRALDTVSAAGGGTVLIPWRATPYYLDDVVTVKSNTKLVFEGKLQLADYTTVGATVVVQGDNVIIDQPRIDNSSIFAGGSGQNGIGIISGNHIRVLGGHVENCSRGKDFVTPGSPNDGGKGVQIEDSAGEDIVVDGTAFSGCFMAMSTIRDGSNASPYYGIIYSNIKADNCDILFFVKQANIVSTDGLQHTVQLNNFYAVNCGAYEGVMQFSRASNVLVSNGMVINAPGAVSTALIRGNHRNCTFKNIMFSGDADSIVFLDPGTYNQDNSYPPEHNTYDIHHVGTVNYLITSSGAIDKNSTGIFQLKNDVAVAFFGYELRNGNSTFQVSQGGKTAIVGTNTNFNLSGGAIKFSQLPLNFSIPRFGANNITFPATQVSSTDPNTLDDYEEGTWNPVDNSGAALAFTTAYGNFTKIGRMVFAVCRLTFPTTANGSATSIGGLPYARRAAGGQITEGSALRYTDFGSMMTAAGNPGATTFTFFGLNGSPLTNANLSGKTVDILITYMSET